MSALYLNALYVNALYVNALYVNALYVLHRRLGQDGALYVNRQDGALHP